MNFKPFAAAVHQQFEIMSKGELYVVDLTGDELYAAYLASFPEGTNPIYRKATQHECSCCRSFIKNIGLVVSIQNGVKHSVWDVTSYSMDEGYKTVAAALSALVNSKPVVSIFRADQRTYGAAESKELNPLNKNVMVWNHFHGKLDNKHFTTAPGAARGTFDGDRQVFQRGLEELTLEALQDVKELIDTNNLYRGLENQKWLNKHIVLRAQYDLCKTAEAKELFILENVQKEGARIRNSAIGQLLVDLSGIPASDTNEGKEPIDLEQAVKMHEDRVSGTNYQRPSALVTPGMKKKALETIQKLGLEDSLVRRLAKPSDVSVNNVLWANAGTKAIMKDGIAGILDTIGSKPNTAKVEGAAKDISVEEFFKKILPTATEIKALVKGRHLKNMAAITAPVHPEAPGLFKWSNGFAWTYTGNISDSITERVKQAGGKTDAALRVSLAWHNGDDLDLHAYEPDGNRVYFANRSRRSDNTGQLDVDMNAGGSNNSINPVENITWTRPGDGVYRIDVNNYNRRSTSNMGFTLEVQSAGGITQYSSDQSPANAATIKALYLTVKGGVITEVKADKAMRGEAIAQTQWGVTTNDLVPVNMIMLSPNYWDENEVGNKHFFFMLEGCATDEPLRGIMNEYLRGDLRESRKVFEVVGDKTQCQPTNDQLAGLGFSSTKGESLTVQVQSKKGQSLYNIIF